MEKNQKGNERKSKDWVPNAKQIKMAELLVNPDDKRSKEAKCAEVDIAFSTLWKWMKDERFVNYVNSQIDKYTNGEVAEAWKALLRQVRRGNIQAIKLFFEMKGLYTERKEISGPGGGAIEVKSSHEQNYNITQTIISEHPELVDNIFGSRVESRSG